MRRWQILALLLVEAAVFLGVIDLLVGSPATWWRFAAWACLAVACFLPLPSLRGGEGR